MTVADVVILIIAFLESLLMVFVFTIHRAEYRTNIVMCHNFVDDALSNEYGVTFKPIPMIPVISTWIMYHDIASNANDITLTDEDDEPVDIAISDSYWRYNITMIACVLELLQFAVIGALLTSLIIPTAYTSMEASAYLRFVSIVELLIWACDLFFVTLGTLKVIVTWVKDRESSEEDEYDISAYVLTTLGIVAIVVFHVAKISVLRHVLI